MRENEMDNITFGPDEKEILNILGSFENNLGDKYKDTNTQIKYYNNFKFNGESIDGLENIFIVAEKDEDGKIIGYDIYTPDMRKIFSTDSKGDITESIEGLEQTLGKLNIKELIEENNVIDIDENGKEQSRLKGISEKAEPEEIQKRLEEKKDENKEVEKEEQEEKEKPEEQIQRDLGEDIDLEISYYRPIEECNFDKQMKMKLNEYKEIGLAYSKAENSFIMIGKNNEGKFEKIDEFENAQTTYKTVISIDENGERVEEKVPHALMKTNVGDKEVSITIGQYGYIEVGTIDRLSCNKRVERQVREQGEGEQGITDPQLNKEIERKGREALHKWVHANETTMEPEGERNGNIEKEIGGNETELISNDLQSILEEYGITEIGDIGEPIHNCEDFEKLIEEEADRVKMSKEGFRGYVKNAEGTTLKEKIDNAQEEIVQEYMGKSRPR